MAQREIKFRAWDEENNNWYQPSPFTIRQAMSLNWVHKNPTANLMFMQFTGLKDKHSKEIYSGDILFNEVKNGVVQWSDKYMGWMSSEIHKMDGEGVYEVIGNVYEHPDLLKPSEGDIM